MRLSPSLRRSVGNAPLVRAVALRDGSLRSALFAAYNTPDQRLSPINGSKLGRMDAGHTPTGMTSGSVSEPAFVSSVATADLSVELQIRTLSDSIGQ